MGGICYYGYLHKNFVIRQIDKVQGMYFVFKGDKAYKSGNMREAINFYGKGLKLFPGHYGAWFNLGNIYVAYEDYYSALDAYSNAYKYNPNMMKARMNYGIISTEKFGSFDLAIEQYNKIIETERKLISIPYIYDNKLSTKENKAIAYYNIGVNYRLKSLYTNDNWELSRMFLSKAIEAYKNSLEISPQRYDTLYNLGLAYYLSGDYHDAGKYYCKAIKVSPMSYEAHYNLAVLLRNQKYYKQAYEEIEKASTLISALDKNSAMQLHASIALNDIMRSVYSDNNLKNKLNTAIKNEKEKIKSEYPILNDHGKIGFSEESDNKIKKTFGTCPALDIFDEEY